MTSATRRLLGAAGGMRGLTLVAVLATSAPASAQLLDRVLATVNGEVVTALDVQAALTFGLIDTAASADPTAAAAEQMIDLLLMLEEVNREAGPDPVEAETRRRLEAVRARFPSARAFEAALASTAMTEERLAAMVRLNLRVASYVEQRFAVAALPTESDVERVYRERAGSLAREGRVPPLDEVRAQIVEAATAERRTALTAEWLDRLRRRATITRPYQAVR